MPITTSAKKALRNSAKKRGFNAAKKEAVGKAIKKFRKLVSEKNKKEAVKFMSDVQKILDKSVKTGLIKLNKASRTKSRLIAQLKKIS
jgi:small subunit ribosomal protein S20